MDRYLTNAPSYFAWRSPNLVAASSVPFSAFFDFVLQLPFNQRVVFSRFLSFIRYAVTDAPLTSNGCSVNHQRMLR